MNQQNTALSTTLHMATEASLSDRTMLVNLIIRKKSFRKLDRTASKEVADAHNTTIEKAGRFNKVLIAKHYLDPIEKAAGAVYTHHVDNTLPWAANGARILPAEHYLTYTEAQRKLVAAFEAEVGDFINRYPEAIQEAQGRLNGLFSILDYPAQANLPGCFAITTDILPTPTADDFRVSIIEAGEADKIRVKIADDMQKVATNAIHSLGNRLYEALLTMRDRLDAFSTGDSKRFYTSWVNNVEELVELIPSLNFSNDPEIEALRVKAKELLDGHCVGAVKSNTGLAKQISDGADDILSQMAGYIG